MRKGATRRYVWLFLLAIAVPSLAVAWIGVRLIQQDRELEETRRDEAERRIVEDVRRGLLEHLEGLKDREVEALVARAFAPASEYSHPAVVFAGLVVDERLQLPWETTASSRSATATAENPSVTAALAAGSVAEFSEENYPIAARRYREALAAAQDQRQETRARFLLARALGKAEDDAATIDEYRTLLEADTQTADEFGVPYALYASRQLLRAGVTDPRMAELIEAELGLGFLVGPSELYLLAELARLLVASATDATLRARANRLSRSIELRTSLVEQALALQRAFPQLGLIPPDSDGELSPEPSWSRWGHEWLVSVAPVPGEIQGVVLAGTKADAIEAVKRGSRRGAVGSFEVVDTPDSTAHALAPTFPGLAVRFDPALSASAAQGLRRSFLVASLILVLSVTLLGGYLLWRDVRREVTVARLRSEFVSAVSHELKTPVTSIRMFAETLRMHGTERTDQRTEYLDTIVCESERLSRLLDNVLEFSKLDRGVKQYRPKPDSLADIVRASAGTMRYPYEREGFQLELDIAEDLPEVTVDRDAIEQAILNLLTNAMKYSGEERDVRLSLRRDDGYALIEVTDHGVGIAPDQIEHIFERFYRARAPEGNGASGTGLGLTLVQHIAEAHGGHVRVESEPGQGSTFSLRLPLEASRA